MVKHCSRCKTPFNCQNEARGCWCEDVSLSPEVLRHLKATYDNCLCQQCLEKEKKLVAEGSATPGKS